MPSKQNLSHKICPFEVASRVNSALKIKLIAENVPFSNCFPRKFCPQNKTYRRKCALFKLLSRKFCPQNKTYSRKCALFKLFLV